MLPFTYTQTCKPWLQYSPYTSKKQENAQKLSLQYVYFKNINFKIFEINIIRNNYEVLSKKFLTEVDL